MTTPISDHDLAKLCLATYDPTSDWDNLWTAEDIYCGHKKFGDTDVLAFRGSVDFINWLRNFEAIPKKHPLLGWCHAGFLRYMDLVFENVMAVIGRDIIVTGHSLGAARASILTGLLLAHGSEVVSRVVFGEPRPGFKQLATILQQGKCELRSYRNLLDPVTDVPLTIMPLLRYVHPSPLIPLSVEPETQSDDFMRYHAIALYVQGVQGLIPDAPI